jgi:6-phosphofructokinase 2
VASGSLPPKVPDDFYATLGQRVRERGARFVLDTSGAELRAALSGGGIYLVKASGEELEPDAADQIIRSGAADLVSITLGEMGALLVTSAGRFALPAVKTHVVSTVGAGDSFLAGMTYGLATGLEPLLAFRVAVAAGAAATLSPGTDLCYPEDVERLLAQVPDPERRA